MKRVAYACIGYALIAYPCGSLRAQGESYNSYGSVSVSTTPVPGSNIYLDFIFDTGLDTNATIGAVSSGSHQVFVVPPETTPEPAPAGVDVRDAETSSVSFDLGVGTGTIYVSASPEASAAIYLDYADTGLVTDDAVTDVAVGTHYVSVRKDGTIAPGVATAEVELGATAAVAFELWTSTDACPITVNSIPMGAEIFLDYITTGQVTDFTLTNGGFGTHEVTVQLPGYLLPPPQAVELSAGTCATTISFTLVEEPAETPTPEPTATPTDTPVVEPTATPTDTPIAGPTATPTDTPVVEPTATPTDTPIAGPTATPTDTPAPTRTPIATATRTPSPTRTPTRPPTVTPTPQPIPQASISMNSASFAAGDQCIAQFVLNRSIERPFTAFAVIVMPNGSMIDAITLSPALRPVASNVPRLSAPFNYTLLSTRIPAGAPAGGYEIVAAFFDPSRPITGRGDAFLDVSRRFAIR